MKRLLYFELIKIRQPLTYVFWILFILALVALSYDEPIFITRIMSSNFRYNEDVIMSVFFTSSYYIYMLVLFLIYISSREFSNNTIVRSIYEGFSREDLFLGKLLILGILVFSTFILSRLTLLVIFATKGYSLNSISFMLFNYHFVIAEVFSCFSMGLFGIMLSSLVKNPYWSIGLFVIWGFIEFLLSIFLLMTPFEVIVGYLPLNVLLWLPQKLRYDEFGMKQMVYLFVLQLFYLLVIYYQYTHITWLKKR